MENKTRRRNTRMGKGPFIEIGNAIGSVVEGTPYSYGEVAKGINVTGSTMSKYKNGWLCPTIHDIRAICNFCSYSVEKLKSECDEVNKLFKKYGE